MKIFKRIITIVLSIILLLLLVVGGYVIYLQANYYRIEDNMELSINTNSSNNELSLNDSYTISTYNMGFGAYSQEFTFFMDEGIMKDGTRVKGYYSRGMSYDDVLKNTKGSVSLLDILDCDFYFVQEVDTNSTRSYEINQAEAMIANFSNYNNVFASNFHSGYLFYPITRPHGTVNSGILTLSRYKIDSSIRRSLPISTNFVEKFFDLDRCIVLNYLPIENSDKQLVLINVHMSAYDEGGVYRAKQVAMLNEILTTEYEKGNYVIAGGDFNHDISNSAEYFISEQLVPDWLAFIDEEDLASGFSFANANNNAPTCRGSDITYQKDYTYTCVVDGFIISDNINLIDVENINNEFLYSDHNPVKMEFSLK